MPSGSDGLRDLGVVVVTYRSAGFVDACLSALPVQELSRVVVVDNASPDDTVAVVRRGHPGVDLVASDRNLGFGAGCNAGAERLPLQPYLLFLNPDAVVDGDTLRTMLGYLKAHPDVGMLAPRLHDGAAPLHSAGRQSTWRSEWHFVLPQRFKAAVRDRRFAPEYSVTGPVGYVEGACMMLRAEAFRRIGGFDERYFLFFEELDLARRLTAAGYATHLLAGATAQHAPGSSRKGEPDAGRLFYWTSCVRYLRRWHGPVAAALFSVVATVSWVYELAARAITRAQLRGAVRALATGWSS